MTTQLKAITFIVTLLLLAAGLVLPAPSAAALADSITTRRGSIGDEQSLDALTVNDQFNTDDDWLSYIEFVPEYSRHASIIETTPTGVGDVLTVALSYRGPDWQDSQWRLRAYDHDAQRWVTIFTSRSMPSWEWTLAEATIEDAQRFVDQGGISLHWGSSRDADVSQLDYLSLHLSGDLSPVAPPPQPTPQPTATPAPPQPTAPPAPPQPTPQPTAPPAPPQPTPEATGIALPPVPARFDYQIGQDYPVPAGVNVVSRDWHAGQPADGVYSICYVNAFQTQPDSDGSRVDETSKWPSSAVLTSLADDPNWSGEYLIDLSTAATRTAAANWVEQMVATCKNKGFDAVEFDNLDSWTRFEGTSTQLPFGQAEAVAYASLIVNHAHSLGLAVGQKNTTQLIFSGDHLAIGFDFAIAEECGTWAECGDFLTGYDIVLAIEYTDDGFAVACGFSDLAVVQRDLYVRPAGQAGYVYRTC